VTDKLAVFFLASNRTSGEVLVDLGIIPTQIHFFAAYLICLLFDRPSALLLCVLHYHEFFVCLEIELLLMPEEKTILDQHETPDVLEYHQLRSSRCLNI
jgi:hypothetical protein